MGGNERVVSLKKRSKKGFTLMEMLIVVAIIAVLVAVAIPVFSAQLDKAKEQVDAANLRSATSMAVADYLANPNDDDDDTKTYFGVLGEGDTDGKNHTLMVSGSETNPYPAQSKKNKGKVITITISEGGKVEKADWE